MIQHAAARNRCITSTLIDVGENVAITDEIIVDGTRVVVFHEIAPQANCRRRITYRTEITGPAAAAEFDPMVTDDFAAVLSALKKLAENI